MSDRTFIKLMLLIIVLGMTLFAITIVNQIEDTQQLMVTTCQNK